MPALADRPSGRPEQRPDRHHEIGLVYDATRRSDPRIDARIRAALAADPDPDAWQRRHGALLGCGSMDDGSRFLVWDQA